MNEALTLLHVCSAQNCDQYDTGYKVGRELPPLNARDIYKLVHLLYDLDAFMRGYVEGALERAGEKRRQEWQKDQIMGKIQAQLDKLK